MVLGARAVQSMSSFSLRLYIEDELPTDKLSKSAKVLGWKMAPWGKMLAMKA